MVVIFDSLGSKHRRSAVERLKEFIISEAKAKCGLELYRRRIAAMYAKVPIQMNLTDCGCFLLETVSRFLASPEETIARLLLREDLSRWYSPAEAADKRLVLRQRIDAMTSQYALYQAEQPTCVSASSDIEEIFPQDLEIQQSSP